MTVESVERRVLGAVRFLDATTGLPVLEPLRVEAAGVRWIRNRQGDWVIASAPGLGPHTVAFVRPPAVPLRGTMELTLRVSDPTGVYLARQAHLQLPREPDPAAADEADSLFTPAEIALFPSPAAPVRAGWSQIRVTVTAAEGDPPFAGALLRVVRESDDVLIASGLTDARGEALVAVQGIPSATFGEDDGPVLATEISARIEAVFDPAADDVPDPGDLEDRQTALRVAGKSALITLASGRVTKVSL